MIQRLRALLVHGMGSHPTWYDPFLPRLRELGIDPVPLTLPSLETHGPDAWCQTVQANLAGPQPVILVGHSLGAAVCLRVAQDAPVNQLLLLAMPPFVDGFAPPPPPRLGFSITAEARVARFLHSAGKLTAAATHFVGDNDRAVPLEQARKLPFPLIVIPGASHQLNGAPHAVATITRHLAGNPLLDPAVRRLNTPGQLALGPDAPAPARLDIEITTACRLACRACARSLRADRLPDAMMPPELFGLALDSAPFARQLYFVGLGEPLLHPQLAGFTRLATQRGLRTHLVTNGLLATPQALTALADAGLTDVTFSIDSAEPEQFATLRGGAPLRVVLDNFHRVPAGLPKWIFVTWGAGNADALPGLVDFAVAEKLPAIAVSDLNFAENAHRGLRHADRQAVAAGLAYARDRGLLVLGPWLHELPDPRRDYRCAVVRQPAELIERADAHRHCLAPWRIAVIGADGTLTPCNCAPTRPVGNIATDQLAELWNGFALRAWRQAVLDGTCRDCATCPRR